MLAAGLIDFTFRPPLERLRNWLGDRGSRRNERRPAIGTAPETCPRTPMLPAESPSESDIGTVPEVLIRPTANDSSSDSMRALISVCEAQLRCAPLRIVLDLQHLPTLDPTTAERILRLSHSAVANQCSFRLRASAALRDWLRAHDLCSLLDDKPHARSSVRSRSGTPLRGQD